MKKILIYFSVMFLISCSASKDTTDASGNETKSPDFINLHYGDHVVKYKVPIEELKKLQYRLSGKIVYSAFRYTERSYAEGGDLVLESNFKPLTIEYPEEILGTFDLTQGGNPKSFFVDYGSGDNPAPSLRMTSNGGDYYPPASFKWRGYLWKVNNTDVQLQARPRPKDGDKPESIVANGKSLGAGEGSGEGSSSGSDNNPNLSPNPEEISPSQPEEKHQEQQTPKPTPQTGKRLPF